MSDVVLLTYDLEPGGADDLRRWLGDVDPDADETADLLEREGMRTESLFVREADGGDELWWYQEAHDVERVLEAYEAADDVVEESRALFEDVLVGGLDEPAAVLEPVLHAVGPDRGA